MSRVDVLGVGVDRIRVGDVLARVGSAVRSSGRLTIAYANVHVLDVARRDPALRAFHSGADIVYPDGAGVVLGAKVLGESLPERMTGADWIEDFAATAAALRWRVAWVGGEYGAAAAAGRALAEKGVLVVHTDHGYPRTDENVRINALNAARPDVLFVGMGTPHQERWVAACRARLAIPAVWCVGALADVVSGRISRGPAALYTRQEWLARLLVDPRRLWRRYLVGNPRFVARIVRKRLAGV